MSGAERAVSEAGMESLLVTGAFKMLGIRMAAEMRVTRKHRKPLKERPDASGLTGAQVEV